MLTYDTTMTFTNKPTNLKFYADSNRTQELIVENETYLALNGFMSLEDNKKRNIPIYWEWQLETGNTEEEKEENDIIDTSFIGKTMSMQIATTGTQVVSNPYANSVASTTINGRITNYNTVQAAIDAAGNNQGAVVTLLADAQESITIAATQNLVLNMNGKTLSSNKAITILINGGNLTILGEGSIIGEGNNNSEVICISVDVNGMVNLLGNTMIIGLNSGSGSGRGINNYGVTNIKGGNISGKTYGVTNQSYGKINVYNGAVITRLRNTGSTKSGALIIIYGGTINSVENYGEGEIIDYR